MIYTLKELATIKYGKSQKEVVADYGSIPIYGTGGLMGYATKPLYEKPSVIIGRKGTIDKVRYLDKPFWTVDTAFYTEINESVVLPRFFYYKMCCVDLLQFNEGTSIPSLRAETLNRMEFDIPPLPTQQKIAAVLSALDDKIELNCQINANLEQQAQAIFKNWFVDFEPFGGQMPRGWRVGKLSEIIDIRDGTHDSPKFKDSGYPLVTSKHLDSFGIFFSGMKYITEEDYKKINERSKVDTGDILYSMIGTVGNISLVIDNPVKFAIKNVGLFKTSQNPIYKYFVLNYLKSKDIRNYIDQHLAGSTQKYISLSELRNIPFLISDLKVLEEYNLIVEPIIELITNNVKESNTLAAIRDTLLPKLMSGELQVD